MAARLVATGPLSVLIDAHLLQLYRGGVWSSKFCGTTLDQTDHAVLIVGYASNPKP